MKDALGREIRVGDYILHFYKCGSSLYSNYKYVHSFTDKGLRPAYLDISNNCKGGFPIYSNIIVCNDVPIEDRTFVSQNIVNVSNFKFNIDQIPILKEKTNISTTINKDTRISEL